MAGWPQGMPGREIVVKHDGKLLMITYAEEAKDTATIVSPSDWKFTAIFEKTLSTFSFIPPACKNPPCNFPH
jgi:hypothetical protein